MKRLNTFNHSEDKEQQTEASLKGKGISISPQGTKRKFHPNYTIDIKLSLPKSTFSLDNKEDKKIPHQFSKEDSPSHNICSPPQRLKCEKFTKLKNKIIDPDDLLKTMKNTSILSTESAGDDTCKSEKGSIKAIFKDYDTEKAEIETLFTVIKHLNKGYQARISLVRDQNKSNSRYIAKTLLDGEDMEVKRSIVNEYKILKKLSHDGIIRVLDLFIPEENKSMIVMIEEYFDAETLKEILESKSHQFSEEEILLIMRQILAVVSYIHKKNISHRDLTLDNVLYCTKTKTVKVIDFGLAKQVERTGPEECFNELDMLSATGAIWYRAPEMIKGDDYTEKVDLWMCGMIFLQLFLGNPKMYTKKVVKQVKENEEWNFESKLGKQIIKMLLNIDPRKRLSAEDALKLLEKI